MWEYKYSDELYHWKYIKRVRKNGKWRYYYDKSDNELTTMRNEADQAQKALDVDFENYYQKMYNQDMRDAVKKMNSNPDGPTNVKNWYNNNTIKKHTKETYRQGNYLRSKARHTKALYEQYKESGRGKIDSFMEKHGRNIASTLNGVSDSVRNGLNWVKKKLRIN